MIELAIAAIISKPTNPVDLENLEPKPITIQVEEPVELTLEEKIRTNYYRCDESVSYIRADNATCLAKPVHIAPEPQKAVRTAVRSPQTTSRRTTPTGSGWYYAGQCTAWVANKRYVPDGWGNATDWKWHAQAAGWYVGSVPVAGAIGWRYGHVVYAEQVNGNKVLISEQNYDYKSSIRTIWVDSTAYTWIY